MMDRILTDLCATMGAVAAVAGPAIAPYDWIAVSGNYDEPGNWSSNVVTAARPFVREHAQSAVFRFALPDAGTGGTIRFGGMATIGLDDSTGLVAVATGGRVEGNLVLAGGGGSRLEAAADCM